MQLEKIEIVNFRSYKNAEFLFTPGINCVTGPNASGKSNLLEALAYLGYTRSFRWHEDRHLINWGSDGFFLTGQLKGKIASFQLKLTYTPGKKEAFINQMRYRLSDYLGTYPVISFCPDDLYLLKGPPALRRHFLDREISQLDRYYCNQLRVYRHILLQRNRLLRQINLRQASVFELSPWNDQLTTVGEIIVKRRQDFIKSVTATASELFKDFIDKQADLIFYYKTVIKDRESFQEILKQCLTTEISSGVTLYGPHKDDIICLLNDRELRCSASQGQQRAALLTFKLAEVDYFNYILKEMPVVILDDVFSEFDAVNKQSLLRLLQGKGQVFLSITDINDLKRDVLSRVNIIEVNNKV